MAKKIKYFFIRNYHLIFSNCIKIEFQNNWFTYGDIITTGTTKQRCEALGNNWFLILKDNG